MKRVGIIDNLRDIEVFLSSSYGTADAASVMDATGGNTGNVAFVYGARKIVGNSLTRLNWGWAPNDVRASVDQLLICCANQLGTHADLGVWADRLADFNLPVTLLGLGAQAHDTKTFPELPKGTLRFLEVISSLRPSDGPNVAARGDFTKRLLAKHGVESEAAGCPSLHISIASSLGTEILNRQGSKPFERVAVSAGNPWHVRSAPLERVLVDIVNKYQGDYIVQHPISMLHFAYGERDALTDATIDRFLRVYGAPFDLDALLAWYRRHASIFIDAANWMHFLRKFDAAIGPRYHGVALAVQAGLPGCVITIDGRTEELCDSTRIKAIDIAEALEMPAEALLHACRWTKEDADALDEARRRQARAYAAFLRSNELVPSDHLNFLTAA